MSKEMPPDNIIPFTSKVEKLDTMDDREVLEHFLAQLRHPGAAGDEAGRVLEYAGARSYDGLTEDRVAWRERMLEIRSFIAYSDQDWDNLVDESHEDYDAGFAAIVRALQQTRGNESFEEQRKALQILLDVRVAAIKNGLSDTSQWEQLAETLATLPQPKSQ